MCARPKLTSVDKIEYFPVPCVFVAKAKPVVRIIVPSCFIDMVEDGCRLPMPFIKSFLHYVRYI